MCSPAVGEVLCAETAQTHHVGVMDHGLGRINQLPAIDEPAIAQVPVFGCRTLESAVEPAEGLERRSRQRQIVRGQKAALSRARLEAAVEMVEEHLAGCRAQALG